MNEAALQNLATVALDPDMLTMIKERGLTPEALAELAAVLKLTEELWQRWHALGVRIQAEAKASSYVM
jgi:hypothetical protein